MPNNLLRSSTPPTTDDDSCYPTEFPFCFNVCSGEDTNIPTMSSLTPTLFYFCDSNLSSLSGSLKSTFDITSITSNNSDAIYISNSFPSTEKSQMFTNSNLLFFGDYCGQTGTPVNGADCPCDGKSNGSPGAAFYFVPKSGSSKFIEYGTSFYIYVLGDDNPNPTGPQAVGRCSSSDSSNLTIATCDPGELTTMEFIITEPCGSNLSGSVDLSQPFYLSTVPDSNGVLYAVTTEVSEISNCISSSGSSTVTNLPFLIFEPLQLPLSSNSVISCGTGFSVACSTDSNTGDPCMTCTVSSSSTHWSILIFLGILVFVILFLL